MSEMPSHLPSINGVVPDILVSGFPPYFGPLVFLIHE
jgi:hypothetical protein